MTKVHRVLKFKQSDQLKKYIDFDTGKRKHATNSFEKYFFKLMNNSIYGKSMKNLTNKINVTLVNNAKDHKKCVSKPRFISQTMFTKNLLLFKKLKQF